MKLFLALFGFLFSLKVFASDFILNKKALKASDLAFTSHRGTSPYSNYLAMLLHFEKFNDLRQSLENRIDKLLLHRQEAHITVITPPEFDLVLSKKISIDEIEEIAKQMQLQHAQVTALIIGKGFAHLNDKDEETYYVVVSSEDLLNIRRKVAELFVKRGGSLHLFNPDHYYPHITLGYTKRDLHESDGVIKNQKSKIFTIDQTDNEDESIRIIDKKLKSKNAILFRKINIKVCGNEIQVPGLAYAICKGAIAALPVSCTAGTATSAGAACAADIALASASCGVSIAVLSRIAADCINGKS